MKKLKTRIAAIVLMILSVIHIMATCALISFANKYNREIITPNTLFTDVPEGKWFTDAVQYCKKNGYMSGTSETTFSPDTVISRAMLVSVLWRIDGALESKANIFTDVPDDAWYKDAANWAFEKRIVVGTDYGKFSPNSNATREQTALILVNFASYRGVDMSNQADLSGFKDVSKISAWAVTGLSRAVEAGLMSGKNGGNLDPKGVATRAELAQMIYRLAPLVEQAGDQHLGPDMKLYLFGELVPESYLMIMDKEQKETLLPLVAILRAYGAQIEYGENNTVRFVINGVNYILDIDNYDFHKTDPGDDAGFNYILSAAGGEYLIHYSLNHEILLDRISVYSVIQFVCGKPVSVIPDFDNNSFSIDNIKNT